MNACRPLYRTWMWVQFRNSGSIVAKEKVPSVAVALVRTTEMAKRHLKSTLVTSNAFGLEVSEDNGNSWEEWYDDDGNSISELIETRL